MSKIGKINISIPNKVKVSLEGAILKMEGPLGKNNITMDTNIFDLNIHEGKEVSIKPKIINPEKLSAYECGFEPFEDSRMEFDVRFYLVAILFIIFDLEIAFLFPWAVSLGKIGILGFVSMMIFLFILTIGFIYEWKKGALDWE